MFSSDSSTGSKTNDSQRSRKSGDETPRLRSDGTCVREDQMQRKNVAGMSLRGGRRDNFTFCLIEFFPDQNRWFLKSLLQVKDEEGIDGDEAIRAWIEEYELKEIVVDFPLSPPACHECQLSCPGLKQCMVPSV